jgi:hypothetical protein
MKRKLRNSVHHSNDENAVQDAAANSCNAWRALNAHRAMWHLELPVEEGDRRGQPEKVRALGAFAATCGADEPFSHT